MDVIDLMPDVAADRHEILFRLTGDLFDAYMATRKVQHR
jgi:hypothetical protein